MALPTALPGTPTKFSVKANGTMRTSRHNHGTSYDPIAGGNNFPMTWRSCPVAHHYHKQLSGERAGVLMRKMVKGVRSVRGVLLYAPTYFIGPYHADWEEKLAPSRE